jgi:hypothetical protein
MLGWAFALWMTFVSCDFGSNFLRGLGKLGSGYSILKAVHFGDTMHLRTWSVFGEMMAEN